MRVSSALFIACVLCLMAIEITCSSSVCVSECVKTNGASLSHCESSCDYVSSLGNAQVFVDGIKIEPTSEEVVLSDNIYTAKQIHFDKNFYNTPAAFDEVIDFKGELLEKFYEAAGKVFVTPGAKYDKNSKLHLLPVPIPLTDSQFNNQRFMNKLLDIVPSESSEYKTASVLPLSEAYVDFLTSIKVDPSVVDDAPKAAETREKIRDMESRADAILNAYISLEDKCFNAYFKHISQENLSPISYTMDTFRDTNNDCKSADSKLAEHEKTVKQISDYVTDLNPYNRLFEAIGRTANSNFDWNYSKNDIEQFTNYHRQMEAKKVTPASAKYSIPIDITRSFFNHLYLGKQTKYEEKDLKAHLSFSGLGWKESSISPSSTWFDLGMIHRYKSSPTNTKKTFFGLNGSLNRIPTHMIIAYKPEMKMKISRATKEVIAGKAKTKGYRPVKAGSMVFTNIDIRTIDGGKVNEEFELILSANVKDPQIIGFKSDPIVNIPKPPAPAAPKYLQFIDKQISIKTPSNTYICTNKGKLVTMNKNECPSQSHKWIVHNVGEGKVALMSIHGTFLRVHPPKAKSKLELVRSLGAWEKFTMLESGSNSWLFRTAHNTYLTGGALKPNKYKKYKKYKSAYERSKRSSNSDRHNFLGNHMANLYLKSIVPEVGPVQISTGKKELTVAVEPESVFMKYLNKKIYIKNKYGQYLRAHKGGKGSKITTSKSKGAAEQWRVVYGGDHKIGLLSHYGTYLRSSKPKMIFSFLFRNRDGDRNNRKARSKPEKIDLETHMGGCEMLRLVSKGSNKFELAGGCHSAYLRSKSSKVGDRIETSDQSKEVFTFELV